MAATGARVIPGWLVNRETESINLSKPGALRDRTQVITAISVEESGDILISNATTTSSPISSKAMAVPLWLNGARKFTGCGLITPGPRSSFGLDCPDDMYVKLAAG
jgi:hypothetical protein